MARVADIRLSWIKSPSPGIVKRRVIVTVNGQVTEDIEVGAEAEEMSLTINAQSDCSFKTIITDDEGHEVASIGHDFRLGDLEAPLPDTDLVHEIIAVRDEEPTPTPPAPETPTEPTPPTP